MENKNEINVKTNGYKMEVSIQGTPDELGPMIAQLAARLILGVTEKIEDKHIADVFKDATIGSILMCDELNVDMDKLYNTVKEAKVEKENINNKKDDIQKEIKKALEGLKDLLKDLAQK